MALDSNNLYVTDYYNGRVVKFAGNGTYLSQWGGYGSGNGQFLYPYGVAVDSSNNFYVADPGNNRFEKFDSHGNYLMAGWQFLKSLRPAGTAVDSSNNVYMTDSNNNRCRSSTATATI